MRVQQQEIDFSRCQKLGILDRAQLPKGLGISAPVLKLLLKTIYGHSGDDRWCFASQDTLAKECNVSRRQIIRAVQVLKDLYLICVEQKPIGGSHRQCQKVNHVRVIWGNLAQLAGERDEESGSVSGQFHSDKTARSWCQKRPINVTNPSFHSDTGVTLTTKNHQEPPPTSTPEAVAVEIETWEEAEQQLRAEGVAIASKLVREAKASGKSARDVLVVIHDYRANRSRLRGPGAIVTRLRDGAWPEDGIVSGEAQRAKIDALAKDREWKLICTTAKAIEREARRRGASPEERRKELRQKIPPDVLAVLMQDELKFVFE